MFIGLLIPAFIAGFLTFLAPCTLPLVPAYLGFISGVSLHDLHSSTHRALLRRKILWHGILYALGFSVVFVFFGLLFGGLGGFNLHYRLWFERLGGLFIFFLGLHMTHLFRLPSIRLFETDRHLRLPAALSPGRPISSFLFGVTFALGWTPCIGPILGSILLLASSSTTIWQGAALLAVFSLGLTVPFLTLALAIGQATRLVKKLSRYTPIISIASGLFIALLGLLIFSQHLDLWIRAVSPWLPTINETRFINYF